MSKEKIELDEHLLRSLLDEEYENYNEDEILEYEFIQEEETYHDLEKSYEDYNVIIKRISDNKYFKFQYSKSNYHDIFSDGLGGLPDYAYEVTPKIIKTTVYE